eukprot:1865097-Rhodomonas_salina.1
MSRDVMLMEREMLSLWSVHGRVLPSCPPQIQTQMTTRTRTPTELESETEKPSPSSMAPPPSIFRCAAADMGIGQIIFKPKCRARNVNRVKYSTPVCGVLTVMLCHGCSTLSSTCLCAEGGSGSCRSGSSNRHPPQPSSIHFLSVSSRSLHIRLNNQLCLMQIYKVLSDLVEHMGHCRPASTP